MIKKIIFSLSLLLGSSLVSAQTIKIPGLPAFNPELNFLTQDEAGHLEFEPQMNAEDIYQVTVFQVALLEQDFVTAAPIALSLAKAHFSSYMAQRASTLYMLIGDHENALKAASLWRAIEPENDEALLNYLIAAAHSGQYAGLTRELKKRLEDGDQNAYVRLAEVADFLQRLDKPHEAIKIFREVTKDWDQVPGAVSMFLSDFALEVDDNDLAWDSAIKALNDPQVSEMAIIRILKLGESGRRMRALNLASKYIAKHPDARDARLHLVNVLARDKNFKSALKELESMAEDNPEDFELLYYRAQVLAQAEQFDKATEVIDEYIDVEKQRMEALPDGQTMSQSSLTEAYYLKANIYSVQDKHKEAIDVLDQVTEKSRVNEVKIKKAVLYSKLKAYAQAQQLLNEIQPEDDEFYDALMLNIDLSIQQERYQEALNFLEKAYNYFPDEDQLLYQKALMYERLGRISASKDLFYELLEKQPLWAEVYNGFGYVLAENNIELELANDLLTRALAMDPESPYILDSFGWLQYRMGNLELAELYLKMAWDRQQQAEIGAHLAEVLWRMGNQDLAREYLKKAAEVDPDDKALLKILKQLKITIDEEVEG